MVDFSTFRSRSFLGTNIVAFIVSFSMLAMFFFIALYMQNVLGYSPLEAGVRFLPTTLVLIVLGPIAGRLSDRIGPRPLMVAGLLIVSGSLFWQSFLEVDTAYSSLIGAFMLMGVGIGLVMSPMSTAAMNAVPTNKAGVASGVLSMFRMVGGTFGVAVTGALISAIGSSRLESALPAASPEQIDHLTDAIAGGGRGLPAQEGAAVQQAFLDALNTSLKLGALVALIGALVSWWLIGDRVRAPELEEQDVAAAALGDDGVLPQRAAVQQDGVPQPGVLSAGGDDGAPAVEPAHEPARA
jgi:MFS family permease